MNVISGVRTLLVLQLSNYLWMGSDGTCLNNQPEIPLNKLQDTISYKDDLKRADCSYVFPTVQTTEYDAMLAYVTQIDMLLPSGRGCAAIVSIGVMEFCKMPVEGCFLFYPATSRCSLGEIHKIITNGSLPCNKTSFMSVESFPQKFRIKSIDSKEKSVNLNYQYIKCQGSTTAGKMSINRLRPGRRPYEITISFDEGVEKRNIVNISLNKTRLVVKFVVTALCGKGETSRLTSAATTPPSVDENVVTGSMKTTAPTVFPKKQPKCPESFAIGKVSSCNASIAIAITLAAVLIVVASFFGYQSFVRRREKFNVNRDEKTSKGNLASSREEVSRLST